MLRGIQGSAPPWRQPRCKSMVSFVNSHTNATRIGWHLWEIDLRFAPGLPPGRYLDAIPDPPSGLAHHRAQVPNISPSSSPRQLLTLDNTHLL